MSLELLNEIPPDPVIEKSLGSLYLHNGCSSSVRISATRNPQHHIYLSPRTNQTILASEPLEIGIPIHRYLTHRHPTHQPQHQPRGIRYPLPRRCPSFNRLARCRTCVPWTVQKPTGRCIQLRPPRRTAAAMRRSYQATL